MTGQDDPSSRPLPPDAKLLRRSTSAPLRSAISRPRPVAILVDDLQWADDDGLRLLRYLVRADASSPILLVFAIRPEEFAFATEAVNLVADMERVGLVRRLRLHRFGQPETVVAAQLLGGARTRPARPRCTRSPRACRSSSRRWRTPTGTKG